MKMERLKQLIEKRKEKTRLQRDAEIKAEFKVVERDGKLWITHNDVAIMEFKSDASASTIANKLESMRETATIFDRL